MTNQVVKGNSRKAKPTVKQKVYGGSRKANDELRGKRHLTKSEIDQTCKAIRKGARHPDRDELMVLVAFVHGLRVSELLNIKWQHIRLNDHQISIKRLKNGIDNVHNIANKRELMLIRRIHKAIGNPTSGYVFLNERKNAVSVSGFQKMFNKFSEQVLGVKYNAHALRHSCATDLIERGYDVRQVQNYMGHRNIQNTTVYLHESSKQFDNIEW